MRSNLAAAERCKKMTMFFSQPVAIGKVQATGETAAARAGKMMDF